MLSNSTTAFRQAARARAVLPAIRWASARLQSVSPMWNGLRSLRNSARACSKHSTA